MELQMDKIIPHLSLQEQEEVSKKKVKEVVQLIPILLKRANSENVKPLAEILKKSLLPSICSDVDLEVDSLFKNIDKNPQLLFKQKVQDKIIDFIEKRFERDKKIVIQRTSDISKFVTLMGQYINEAIKSNGSGSKHILSIKEEIETVNIEEDGLNALSILQEKLINAANSIESEMHTVSNKLQNGKSKIQELEDKILELEDELTKSKNESMKDHLTGLLTRRAYNDEIKRIESSFERNGSQYAVVFFDLDHFKNINDTYGHECGDVILSTFAKILDKNTRDHDIVGRYGGEEFVAIVHFNLNRELLQYVKRIKTIVNENSFIYKNQKIKVSFSAGVAVRSNYENYQSTLQKSDLLLYEAKENGRNQIRLDNGQKI